MVAAPTQLHLTENELAALSALGAAGVEKHRLEHVLACEACRRAVDDAALYEAMWIASNGKMSWPGQPDRLPEFIVPRRGSLLTRFRSIHWRPVLVAAVALMVVVVGGRSFMEQRRRAALIEPVHMALRNNTLSSAIAIPGFEDVPVSGTASYRSGFVPLSDDLDAALKDLSAAYNSGSDDPQVAGTLIGGYIAIGHFSAARSIARGAVERFPDNTDIQIGAALVEFGEGRLAAAESTLTRVISVQPENALALINLAAVVGASGRDQQAVQIAEKVIATSDEAAYSRRAQLIIEKYGSR